MPTGRRPDNLRSLADAASERTRACPGSVAAMEWTPDLTAGDWLRPRLDEPWRATMHDVVPRGFAAYARVFHPTTRSRPVGRDWPAGSPEENRRGWEAFSATRPEINT